MDDQEIITLEDYDEPEISEPSEPDFEEPQPSDEAPEELSSDWGIDEDGEVKFSDEYLGEVEKNLFPERTPDESAEENEDSEAPEQKQAQPKYYTPEELANTPYEQWDVNRLNGNVKDFVPIVQQQIAARQAQALTAQRQAQNQLGNFIQAPVQYTPKELADAAQALAVERLGLDDPDDFDEYEGEHRAALNLAMQELSGQRQAEIANYQRASGEYQQLQEFNRRLEAQPDFREFYTWYESMCKAKNVTPQQVNASLWNYAQSNGYRFGEIAGIMGSWYREFQQTKASRPRASRPPALEGSRGSSYDGAGSVNLRNFGEMDLDRQARALMKMGIV
ncbi:MAG: hypothetical protein IJR35_11685 [Synergistaceae bacterium]|nr:hypothetical protein [Synergistaceae bacterium]